LLIVFDFGKENSQIINVSGLYKLFGNETGVQRTHFLCTPF